MKPLFRIWTILRLFSGEMILSLLLGIAAVAAGIGLLGASGYIIASAALHPSIATLQIAIVGVRFFGISRGVFRYLERLVSHAVNLRVVSRLREDFYLRVEPGAPANLVSRQGGDVLQRVMGDLQVLENFYVRVISPVIVAFVIIVGISLFIGAYVIELGGILFMGMLVTGFLQPVLYMLLTRRSSDSLVHVNSTISAKLVETLQGLEDIQATNTQIHFFEPLLTDLDHSARQQRHLTRLSGINSGLSLLLMNLTVLIILWAAIPMVNNGTLSGVSMAVITLVVLSGFEVITPLSAAAQNFNASRAAATRFFAIGDQEVAHPFEHKNLPRLPVEIIELVDVGFSYETNVTPILENITLVLKPGKKVAIVGASGAGKTSILNLLLAFQQSINGNIKMDGIDYSLLDADAVRSQFSVLPQNVYLFNEDVRQNLLLAKPEAGDGELLQAISLAGLSAWVESLPDGLDSWIGEHGVKMSGGEQQRLAAARILLQDKPFILLDEPTTNLDVVTATIVMRNLFTHALHKGLLLITHDLDWLHTMDEVLLIDGGRIVERGRFKDLMAANHQFARLYSTDQDLLVEK